MGILMATHPRIRLIWILATCGLVYGALAVCCLRGNAQTRAPVLFMVSKVTGGGDISLGELRSCYENKPTERRGVRLIPFNLPPGNSARAAVDRVLLGLGPDKVGAFWIDQRIRSGISPPRAISTPDMVLRLIASLPGIIAYAEMHPSAVPAGLEVLSIDGKHPTDPGYPLAPL